ncbi:MAG TPA: formylglycine-generating enzyme family protein [Pyrinomonadaceae bacterium]|nr:formylglycine-generating enzyme family protein [Pyrinomonadaceae bacterium]
MSVKSKIGSISIACLIAVAVPSSVGAQRAPFREGMARIPGGIFEMGIEERDIPKLQEKFKIKRAELFKEEVPRHSVTLAPFFMDRTEVTNKAFKRFVDKNPEWQKERISAALHNGKYLQLWANGSFPAGQKNYPVVYVTWYAASAFCRSLGKRLPTEAEWEFAARGALVGKEFSWGDEMPDKNRANFSGSGIGAPTEVASYPPNGYGLYDMSGNVWELLADEWGKYPKQKMVNPSTANDFLQVKTRRALRGGSFGGSAVNLRVTYRDSHLPENAVEHVGFRCVADAR